MNTKQLYVALMRNKITKKCFDGIYARDTLEDIKSKPELIICNTDDSTQEGEHWVVFYFDKNSDSVLFYDSVGNDLEYYGSEFVDFANKYATHYIYSDKRTQPINSSLCGIYCLYFAYFKCKGFSMQKIIKSMTRSSKVLKVVHKIFHVSKRFQCKLLQCCSVL